MSLGAIFEDRGEECKRVWGGEELMEWGVRVRDDG